MKLVIDAKNNPDMLGELLRQEFFKEEYEVSLGIRYRKLGCYSTFEIAEGVVQSEDEPLDEEFPEEGHYHVFEKFIDGQLVTMKYYWDGDGELDFYFDDGMLCNDDCKKTYGWKFYSEKPEDF